MGHDREVMMGNGDRAFEYYKQILPSRRNDEAELLEVESYVYSQNILGKEHPQFGIGRNSWLSGTAAWNMVASSQYILGIRPGYDCLVVDPCIPSGWDGFRARRVFRGAEYRIEVRNPAHVKSGVKKIILNVKRLIKYPCFLSAPGPRSWWNWADIRFSRMPPFYPQLILFRYFEGVVPI